MRHRYTGRQLNRDASSRKAMFRNMMCSMIEHEQIQTTLPKAKELRRFFEPMVTLAKVDTVANRRLAFDRLRSKEAVKKLFEEIGVRSKDRSGGYLRILKAGFRRSDAAPMAWVSLVDRDESELEQAADDSTETSTKGLEKKEAAVAATAVEESVVEDAVVEEVSESAEQAETEQTSEPVEDAVVEEVSDSAEQAETEQVSEPAEDTVAETVTESTDDVEPEQAAESAEDSAQTNETDEQKDKK